MDEVHLGTRILQPRRQLLANGARVPLGKRALDIASVLAEAGGEIVTKDELLEAVWSGVIVEDNALQVHVAALRKALGPDADRLRTIRGVGYQLAISDEARTSPPTSEPQPQQTTLGPADRARWRTRRFALVVVAMFFVAVLAWGAFRSGLLPVGDERIPVVVRVLEASATGDQTEAALARGITDELIVRLRQIPELQVATGRPDALATSDEFRNAYVVDGTIRSSGEELRVTARLSDADGEILWSQTFERNLVGLFEVQERIASSIAGALSVSFDVGANSVSYGGTDNPQAYAAYALGRAHALDFDQSVPVRYFERAIALDPDFVQAHAWLASTYGNRLPLVATKAEADRMLAEMDSASARALEANPDIWNSILVRGWYEVTRKNLPAAEALMRRAAQLDRGIDPELRGALAQYAVTVGRTNQALSTIESNAMIDPALESSSSKVFFLMMDGKFREAVDLFNSLRSDDAISLQAQMFHAFWAHVLLGDEAKAVAFARSLDEPIISAAANGFTSFGRNRAALGNGLGDYRTWANEQFGNGGQFAIANLALVAAHHGDRRLAVDLLRVAFERPGGYALFYMWHPAMADARKTDEFEQLARDLGFVKIWRESGDWGDFCRPVSSTEITCS